jgi:hypothetical protein
MSMMTTSVMRVMGKLFLTSFKFAQYSTTVVNKPNYYETTKKIKHSNANDALPIYKDILTHAAPNSYVMHALIKVLQDHEQTKAGLFLVDDALTFNITDPYVLHSLLKICILNDNTDYMEKIFDRIVSLKLVSTVFDDDANYNR